VGTHETQWLKGKVVLEFLRLITSADGGYVFTSVCLSVCPPACCRNSRSILIKLCTVVWNPKS